MAAINMASFTFILLAVSLLVATSSAAPQNTKLGIAVPEKCRGKGFCSIRPDGYDEIEAQINELLPLHMINVGSRTGGGPIVEQSDDDDNCPSYTKWESVYTIDDPEGKKTDIIVQTKLFPQIIARVFCKHSEQYTQNLNDGGSQCFRKLGLSAFNMESRCEESYATRKLLVFDPAARQLHMKDYKVPVCCSCVIRNM